ncbi:ATP-binding protein [Pseudomonas sp. sp1636]|uniref:ATP-binding protein n=1 Tax=Pseudomonas sp. sp1636 TaxID=3036707 RepID=UPI0025A5FCBB|nr:ATP-binding protein [Pseudomonas sp. sp1636]MDM8350304.1 ATP-binding protein [Pseudomonas sp. sp1636]
MNASAHPLKTDQALFITHQMVRVLRLSLDRVAARRSGVLFEGASRVGKTRCAQFVAEQLKIKLPGVFTMLHIARHREPGRRQSVLKEICESERASPNARGVDYLQHLLAYIEGHVTGQPAPQCVLVVDEIQQWRQNDFRVLSDLHNYLQSENINLTVIGFAQSEIYHLLSGLRAVKRPQIVARFFAEIIPFHGCRSVDELTAILQACDEGSEYPVGSGTSYTAFFATEAFAAGLRLAPLAGLFWKAFDESVAGEYVNNLPMQHVRESILDLLLLIAPHDNALFEADDKLVIEAVRRTSVRMFCDVL